MDISKPVKDWNDANTRLMRLIVLTSSTAQLIFLTLFVD